MKKCLIIINNAAGKSKRISFEKVEKCLGKGYDYTRFSLPDDGEYLLDGYDAVAVCGGDGTLGSLLSKAQIMPIEVFYFPSGTLNDRAKSKRYDHARSACPACADVPCKGRPVVLGCFERTDMSSLPLTQEDLAQTECPSAVDAHLANPHATPSADDAGEIFSYVFATGSFTPIGYAAQTGLKKRIGVFAYILQILKQYRVCRIPANIRCGKKQYQGDFTLIMALKSPRCFGFGFNKDFDPESVSGHLIAIRSPKHGGILGLVEMFFPFFRVFFMGMKREREGKIIFKRIYSCDIQQFSPQTYCRDGEKCETPACNLHVKFVRSLCNFSVIDKF